MKLNKIIYIFFIYFLFLNNSFSIEPDQFVQSTVDRASKLLSNNISKEKKINELQIIAKQTVDIKATKEGISEVGSHKPIFLKISPDEKISTITEIINTSINENIDALVISNTTIERPVYLNSKYQYIKGGLSGNPLFKKSTKLLENIHKITNGKIDLVGVGGVESANQAYVKILVGAKLIQLYTGLLFQGPNIVKIITSQLSEFLKRDGFNSLEDAVGTLSYEEAAKLNNLEY